MSTTLLCPKCGGTTGCRQARKAVTRPNSTWRRRECNTCGHRFSTIESQEETILAEAFIIVMVPPGQSEPFTVVVDNVAKIGGEVARICGPRSYPATIHHWKLHQAINGPQCDWRKEKVSQWP